jgi:hypothetical protein
MKLTTGSILTAIVLTIGLFYVTLSTMTSKYAKIISTQQSSIDSLVSENISQNIEIGRYEIVFNRLWELDSNFVDSAFQNVE